ncbi:MAG: hypothetical protein EOO01_35935 [Chitinophagaceae bacterium]|nr:MAG: hypothetical protein EOO01_35935 [Chitinophagaceae bacterium]
MKVLFVFFVSVILLGTGFNACKSDSAPVTFCDTACLKDSIKFVKEDHPYKPYVYISAANCNADTLAWSYIDMGVNRKLGFNDLLGTAVKINKDYVSCFIKDTSYAWLLFNDCSTGRGYSLKIPFNKKADLGRKSSALNKFDPKFSVADGLVAYSDRGNLFVEDMATGKTAMMTFGARVETDYADVHKTIDSINVTPTRLWAKVLVNNEWKEFNKNIELK